MRQFFRPAAFAFLIAVWTSPAAAFSGDLIKCTPTAGTSIDVEFKKGLVCQDTKQKIKIKTKVKDGNAIDGCVANLAAPWDIWASKSAKWFKTDADQAALISQAEISLKGQTYGSCNFAGSPTSAGASGSGAVTFLTDLGAIKPGKVSKVKGAKLKFFGTVSGSAETFTADAIGLITKGLGIGMDILVRIGLDLTAAENGLLLACNGGGICTDLDPDSGTFDDPFAEVDRCVDGPNAGLSCDSKDDCAGSKCKGVDPLQEPIEVLKVVTDANSMLLISSGDANDPNYLALP